MNGPGWRIVLSYQTILVQASWSGVRLMVGYRALALGADPLFLGLLASCFALPAFLCALAAGRLSDRIGGPVVALAGMIAAAVGTLGAFAFAHQWTVLAAASCIGLGHMLIMVGQQTFVANVSASGSSDAAFGTLTAAASIGQLVGPPLVTAVASLTASSDEPGPNTTAGLIVCVVLVAFALPSHIPLHRTDRSLTALPPSESQPTGTWALLKTPDLWRSLVVSGAVLVSVDLMYTFVPLWAIEQDVNPTMVGLLLALRALVSVVSRFGLTRLVARFGRKFLILGSIAAAVAALIALPFVGAWGAVLVMIEPSWI
ncbi:MFS transporter [Rhodococcoides kyotonense]|uniref:Major Facilitator Superfamily protein n=1 Tax=Rhodococcoides kyotonense TaxID=398843 RepID=A0A239N203_9NOCA|nr:MFS transporter [Rhodococcus kyotonensis]SNT48472.1 Major Facilitator Superfamily protein [Rhodococcus kyotonensis]